METILVVDDDSIILLLIQKLLSDEGYRIITAKNGLEAQKILQERGDEIVTVLLDWSMPVMNGIELLRWVKNEPLLGDIPIVMQTGMGNPENIREGIDAGAYYYLVKPLQKNILRSIVRSAVSDFRFKESLRQKLKESENPLKFLEEGVFRFQTRADAEYLALRIANASPLPEKAIVISELLVNAVEHGNLGITYDEMTTFLEQGKLGEEINRRLTLPEYKDKKARVAIHRNSQGMTVTIEDEGNGFDFKRYLVMDESRVFDNHGRGIALTKAMLDIEFLGKGNSVRVKIPLEKPS